MTNRKLQKEIDQLMKKVGDNIEIFDALWDKVYAATVQNQKEKYEAELKKEIKKLQRFREQMKAWIGSNDVKDKKVLIDGRKLIETKMEQFKICEKETKTKKYSKDGLALAEKVDPEEQAKINTREWIQDCMNNLTAQIDSCEAEVEQMMSKKRHNKAEVEKLESAITMHKWHITNLEQATRLMDNDALKPSQIDEIRDDIEYYLECSQDDPDFMESYEDSDMYEMINMDTATPSSLKGSNKEEDKVEPVVEEVNEEPKPIKADGLPPRSKPIKPVAMTSIGRAGVVKPVELSTAVPSGPGSLTSPGKPGTSRRNPDPPSGRGITGASPKGTNAKANKGDTKANDKVSPGRSNAPILSPQPEQQQQLPQQSSRSLTPVPQSSTSPKQQVQQLQPQQLQPQQHQIPTTTSQVTGQSQEPNYTGPISQISDEHYQVLSQLDASIAYVPDVQDTHITRPYMPKYPYPTHPSFPSAPPALFENPAVFAKFETDALFFIFYYQQGTYPQYLAAKELKKHTWAYHKKYSTWFKRHEEPKITCEEYEQGTYVYFDHEQGWLQRIKAEFTFEYSYLEDELKI